MQFPFIVQPNLSGRQVERYRKHIDSDATGWHRRWTESIWRRHQDQRNQAVSGWRRPQDARRRLIHFYDEYGIEGGHFVLRNAYLSLNVTLPAPEVKEYRENIVRRLRQGGWQLAEQERGTVVWQRGGLQALVAEHVLHPEDEIRGKSFPPNYEHLEVRVHSRGYATPGNLERRPWRWFYEVGLRDVLKPGRPAYVEPEELIPYLPAQLELGCGPSTEAGVSHLSVLHRIYGVSRPDYSFVFRAQDDTVLEVLSDPERKYREMTAIYRECIVAEPTPFYVALADLWRQGYFVGPVITNNFDCLCADMGLPETSLRRYDSEPYFPMYRNSAPQELPIHPEAKSLLVVGVHADRRMAQRYARKKGLQVIYIDPERYIAPDGSLISYPVESPQDGDLFVRLTAGEAMPRIYQSITGETIPDSPIQAKPAYA